MASDMLRQSRESVSRADRHWDSGYPHAITKCAPISSIFITVLGEEGATGEWHRLHRSQVHSIVPHRDGVRLAAPA